MVRAFNQDLPFDRFVAWQIAGDELAPRDPWALAATGFLGAGPFPTQLTEAEFESARYDELDDMVSAVGTAFLGLTVGCARCHDHKFDPITARDYYRLAATFTTIRTRVDLPLGAAAHRAALRRWQDEHARLTDAKEIAKHLAFRPPPGLTPVMVSTEGRKPLPHLADERGFPHFYPQTHFLRRGDVRQKLGVATPGVLPVLLAGDEGRWQARPAAQTSGRRQALARWLVDARHGAGHLMARVIVNRLWQHHLGRGLVATPNDFGRQGAPPTHPQLLDWLASELVAGGWRLKPIHRLIPTSATYRQSGAPRPQARQLDPEETLYWRWTPRRLEAEAIRDVLLATAGLLDERPGGPGTLDETSRRRSLYLTVKRSKLIPALQVFDAPDALGSVGRRQITTVAPQALLLMNAPQVRQWAAAFAGRVGGRPWPAAVRAAYERALGRAPTPEELADGLAFLDAQGASYGDLDRAFVDLCHALFGLSELIYLE